MKLKKYNEKRDFNKTSEPKGKIEKSQGHRFVVQYHQARRDHYDFRLEHGGVLISWAVPKGLSLNSKDKRLAVKVEDHPVSYIDFEGIIPKGEYGAGKVEIYDKGKYAVLGDLDKGLEEGSFKVALYGEKLQGVWAFVHFKENNWLAIFEFDILNESTKVEKDKENQKLPFKKVEPQLATLSKTIPTGGEWIFEIKYDGYRIIALIEKGKVKLLSRNGHDYTTKFNSICESLQRAIGDSGVILDGEVVVFDDRGRSDFSLLQEHLKFKKGGFQYVVFDILAKNNRDLRGKSLKQRKEILEDLSKFFPDNIIFSQYVEDKGEECYALAKKLGLEGIVAKKLNSKYSGTRCDDWLKIKCYNRQEFVIGGYTLSEKNDLLASILLGYYEDDNLLFIGSAGTGFTDKVKKELLEKFKKIERKSCPFKNSDKVPKKAKYISPKLVAEVQFAEVTRSSLLRQASYIGLREDKEAQKVVKEWK